MQRPYHELASLAIASDASSVHGDLTAEAEERVGAATGDALTALTPRIRTWGLEPTALPETAVRPTDPEEFGALEVTWTGDEGTTGWPALTAQLLVTPEPGERSRLRLYSQRSPGGEAATRRVGRIHRRRIAEMAVQRFLFDLGRPFGGVPVGTGAADALGAVGTYDRAPQFLHHLEELPVAPDTAHALLVGDAEALAVRATDAAVAASQGPLVAGRFLAPAEPHVRASLARADEPATVWIDWSSDEEATGWPEMRLGVLLEAHASGSRLVVLSTREPAYDLSRNRLDKQHRHAVIERSGADVAAAVADALCEAAGVAPVDRRSVVTAGG